MPVLFLAVHILHPTPTGEIERIRVSGEESGERPSAARSAD